MPPDRLPYGDGAAGAAGAPKGDDAAGAPNGDDAAGALLAALNHEPTRVAVVAERSFLAALDGSCRTPIAGLCRQGADGGLTFRGLIARTDGSDILETAMTSGTFTAEEGVRVGAAAGAELKGRAGPGFFDWAEAQAKLSAK